MKVTKDFLNSKRKDVAVNKDNFIGCLVGLAVGDAYGTTFEFRKRNEMPSELPDEITGGGVFKLNPGDWTDDTSMALCLAESLIEKEKHNTADQMSKYIKWWKEGYNSVNGKCFDIGNSTWKALDYYDRNKKIIEPSDAAGNGVLMRLAPAIMFYCGDNLALLAACVVQTRITHPSSQAAECSMLMGLIINKILKGEKDKKKILYFDNFSESEKLCYQISFEHYKCVVNDKIESIKKVEYENYTSDQVLGNGYCVLTLEAALWAFLLTDNFEDGLKKVVSLGEDTDTTGAVYGQIAGAYYGLEQIKWKSKITWANKINDIAEKLYELNLKQ